MLVHAFIFTASKSSVVPKENRHFVGFLETAEGTKKKKERKKRNQIKRKSVEQSDLVVGLFLDAFNFSQVTTKIQTNGLTTSLERDTIPLILYQTSVFLVVVYALLTHFYFMITKNCV